MMNAISARDILLHPQSGDDSDIKEATECAINALEKISGIEHFLKVEIELSTKRLNSGDDSPFFNGVVVGHKKAVRLMKLHILFCQHLLKLIEKGV